MWSWSCWADATLSRELRGAARDADTAVSRLERALCAEDECDALMGAADTKEEFGVQSRGAIVPTVAKKKDASSLFWGRDEPWWSVYADASRDAAKRDWLVATRTANRGVAAQALADLLDHARRQFEAVHALTGSLGDDAAWALGAGRRVKAVRRELAKLELLDDDGFGHSGDLAPDARRVMNDALRSLYEATAVCSLVTSASGRAASYARGAVFSETLAALRSDVDAAVDELLYPAASGDDDHLEVFFDSPPEEASSPPALRDGSSSSSVTGGDAAGSKIVTTTPFCVRHNKRRSQADNGTTPIARQNRKFVRTVIDSSRVLSVETKAMLAGVVHKTAAFASRTPQLRDLLLTSAELLATSGDAESARRVLTQAPHQARDAVACTLMRGAAYYHEGKFRDALAHFAKAVDRDAKDADAWFALGAASEKVASSVAALDDEDDDDEQQPSKQQAHAAASSFRDDQIAAYERCLALDPRHAVAHACYAALLHASGAVDAAEREYKIALALEDAGGGPVRLLSAGAAAEKPPVSTSNSHKTTTTTNPAAHANYATLLMNDRGEYDAAERHFRIALEADPLSVTTLNNYALLQLNARDDAEAAETLLRRALEADPANALAHNSYGLLLKTKRRAYLSAEAHYSRAIEADPTYAAPLYNLGVLAHEVLKDLGRAESLYRRALALDPHDAAARNNLGRLLEDRRDASAASSSSSSEDDGSALHCSPERRWRRRPPHEAPEATSSSRDDVSKSTSAAAAAEAEYRAALEADPADPVARNNLAGLLLEREGHSATAEALYRTAVELDPHYADARNNLATLLYEKRGDLAGAEEHYRLALLDAPASQAAHVNYGRFLRAVHGDLSRAEQHFKAAIVPTSSSSDEETADDEKNPALTAAAHAELASVVLEARGDVDAAEREYRAALVRAPDHAAAHAGLAEVCLSKGDTDAAHDHATHAIGVLEAQLRTIHGVAPDHRGRDDEDCVAATTSRGDELHGLLASARWCLACVHERRGAYAEAVALVKRVLDAFDETTHDGALLLRAGSSPSTTLRGEAASAPSRETDDAVASASGGGDATTTRAPGRPLCSREDVERTLAHLEAMLRETGVS